MVSGLHHFHKRKRKSPVVERWKRRFDKWIYVLGILAPIVTIPQVMKIWVGKNAGGLSLVSWTAYMIGAIFWIFYGLFHKEKPIVFAFGFIAFLDLAVVLGIILYG